MQPGGFRERGDDRWMGWWLVMRGADLFGYCERAGKADVGPARRGRGVWRCRVAVTGSPALSPSLSSASAREGFVCWYLLTWYCSRRTTMALIKPELTERDGEDGEREEEEHQNQTVNRKSRSARAVQIKRLKGSDLCSLTTAICLGCVMLKQRQRVRR